MEIFILFVIILEVVLTSRNFSFVGAQWYLFSLRDSISIERFCQKQKACDSIIVSYNTTAALTHLCGAIMLMSYLFDFRFSPVVLITISSAICLLLLLQIVFRYATDKRYDLKNSYNAVVEFKRREKVVGKDNDYEVVFIRAYRKIKSERWWNVIWIVYIVSLSAFILVSE
ncbi:MAG: hypothetical protein II262_06320 [Alistipes sp.]|nr:hypothetical protein [Alistipes sp.]